MNEDRFDELMRDAAHTFRVPPQADFEAMWTEIDRRSQPADGQRPARFTGTRRAGWLAIAATLIVGIGLGRASMSMGHRADGSADTRGAVASARRDSILPVTTVATVDNSYEVETSKYLGQTAALLIALPSEVKGGRANQEFVGRAGELLTTTRLLLDSPAASDPSMRNLLEDLELVLAQVVRLQSNHSSTEVDLINRALEQRDVIPRLRTAVGDYTAN